MIKPTGKDSVPYSDHTRLRISLRAMLFMVALTCVLLAIPGMYVLGVAITGWMVSGVVMVGALLLIQWPLYFLLKRKQGDS